MADKENKTLLWCVIDHLRERAASGHATDSESVEVACQCIIDAFALTDGDKPGPTAPSLFAAYKRGAATFERDLMERPDTAEAVERVPAAGGGAASTADSAASTGDSGAGAGASGSDDLAANPLFQKYLTTVTNRGVFGDLKEGTAEYDALLAKVKAKFRERTSSKAAAAAPGSAAVPRPAAAAPPAASSAAADAIAAADAKKNEANAALKAGNLSQAVDLYSDAIALCGDGPSSHIYYANRAAALTSLRDYDRAVDDCRASVALQPSYAKGHSRLGTALFYLQRYDESIEAYETALRHDPSNAAAREQLTRARERKEAADKGTAAAVPAASGAPTGAANTTGAGGLPGMPPGGLPGGLGGLMNNPMVAQMMQNPEIMGMAQQMMSNPAMMQNMMGMLGGGGGGGGGGGMPDLSALAGMMGGMGGGAPAAPSAASGGTTVEDAGGPEEEDTPGDDPGWTPAPAGSSSATAAAPGVGGAPGGMAGMMAGLRDDPRMAAYRDDPRLAEFFADIESGGPAAAMRHMGNPAVMEMMSAMMGSMSAGGAAPGGGPSV